MGRYGGIVLVHEDMRQRRYVRGQFVICRVFFLYDSLGSVRIEAL